MPLLVLSRKLNESIIINENIVIRVLEIKDNIVKLGVEAPRDIPVFRSEVFEEIKEENLRAAQSSPEDLNNLLSM